MHRHAIFIPFLGLSLLLTACGSSVRDPVTIADLKGDGYASVFGLQAGGPLPGDEERAEIMRAVKRRSGQENWNETLEFQLAPGSDVHGVSMHVGQHRVYSIQYDLPPVPSTITAEAWRARFGIRLVKLCGVHQGVRLWYATDRPGIWCAIESGGKDTITAMILSGFTDEKSLRTNTGATENVAYESEASSIAPLLALPLFNDSATLALREKCAELISRRLATIAAAKTPGELYWATKGADAEAVTLVRNRLHTELAAHARAGRIATAMGCELVLRFITRTNDFWRPDLVGVTASREALAVAVGRCLPRLLLVPDPQAAGAEILRGMLEDHIPALRLVRATPTGWELKLHVVEGGGFTFEDKPVRRATQVANTQAIATWQNAEDAHLREVAKWKEIEAANRNHSGFTEKVAGTWSVTRPVDIGRVDGTTNVTQTTNYQQVERTPWRDEAMAKRHAEATQQLAALAVKPRAARPAETVATTIVATERKWSGKLRLEGEVFGSLVRNIWERDASIVPVRHSDTGPLPSQEDVSTGPRDSLLTQFATIARASYQTPFTVGLEKHLASLAGASAEERKTEAAWMRLLLGIPPEQEDGRVVPTDLRESLHFRPAYRAPRPRR